jgi:SAM-dependent methyltransferase
MRREPVTSTARPAARALFAGMKAARHAWLRLKLARRVSTLLRRGAGTVNRRLGSLAVRARRRSEAMSLAARQLAFYRVPGERYSCPACGSPEVEHLEPLSFSRPIASGWRVGFISGCGRCGLLFANPLPDSAHLDEVYSPEGDWGRSRQDEQEEQVTARRLERLFAPIVTEFNVLQPPPGARVLDFGCGLGGMLDGLKELGWRTYGIDPATRVAFQRHHQLKQIPAEATFDLTILHHVLEHLTEPLAILRQLAAATRIGGYLMISVPDLADAYDHGDLQYCLRSKTHVMAYTTACLEWLCNTAGFRVVSSVRTLGGKSRQRVVLARRESGRWPLPVAPLRNARAALDRYYARFPDRRAAYPTAPIRTRAALVNLRRRRQGGGAAAAAAAAGKVPPAALRDTPSRERREEER